VVEFRVLGPLEVYSDDTLVHVGGVKQRSILALLIAHRGEVVSTDRIVDEVYGDEAAVGARRSVQTIVSMLRRDLGDVIVGSGGGYRFDAARSVVDVYRFEDLVAAGLDSLRDNSDCASLRLGDALGLWRGDPYSDVEARGVFQAEIARLDELRFTALEARIEADLACGRHRQLVAELEALVADYPLRERLWAALMLALYRVGRQADALAAYQRARTVLGEELGLEPSVELRELEEQILLHDAALDLVVRTPHNLPAQLTSFIGRSLELIELGESLAETSLVTLTGTGGSGKTRLAVEYGQHALDDYPDGVWFVDLRGSGESGVMPLIASTLGVVASGEQLLAEQLAAALSLRRLLLVLDNCEHVLDAVSPFVERLVSREGRIRVLATSREPLGVPGELVLSIPPLPVPEWVGRGALFESEAATLFSDRARRADPSFVPEDHVASVCSICQLVEGLPLALELAAARLRIFSPDELADRLGDQLATLKTTQRTGDTRHATIEATIRWSWELLDHEERTLLSRMSVFRGTCSMAAAEAICGFAPISDEVVADLVGNLVDKSLIVVDGISRGSTRYRLLESIRQFASRQLSDRASERLRGRVVDYWRVTLSDSYQPADPVGLRDHRSAWSLEADEANLTAAVEWAMDAERFEDAMSILASPFGDLLSLQGSAFELATGWMDMVRHHRERVSPAFLIWALKHLCEISNMNWRNEACLGYAEEAIEVARTDEERHYFELFKALATSRLGQHDKAIPMYDRIVEQSHDPGMRASALLAKSQYEPPREAWALCEAVLALSSIDSLVWWDEGVAAWLVGEGALDVGRYDLALQLEERCLDLSRRGGWNVMHGHAGALVAWLYSLMGRLDEAVALIAETIPVARRILGPNITILSVLVGAADIARLRGDLDKARSFVEEARWSSKRKDILARSIKRTTLQSALIARDDGAYEDALQMLDDLPLSLADLGAEDDTELSSRVWTARASIEVRSDMPDRAIANLKVVLDQRADLAHLDGLEAVDLVAIALAQQGNAAQAATLFGAVDRERDNCGLVVPPPDIPIRETTTSHARAALGDDWDTYVEQGYSMRYRQAVERAAGEIGGSLQEIVPV
jgi:predicted ATPase/DNA-binding SARP family transcriptional activator